VARAVLACCGRRRALQLARDDAPVLSDQEGWHLHPERFTRSFHMSPEEYRLQAETAPGALGLVPPPGGCHRGGASGLRDELGEGGRPGAR
jgi:hypothetical protein